MPKRVVVWLSAILAWLLTLTLLQDLRPWRGPETAPPTASRSVAPAPTTAAEALLRRASQLRNRARLAVTEEMQALQAWDPGADASVDGDAWRLQEMARDKSGDLRAARELVEQAGALARTPYEKRRVLELQVLCEHEAGRHDVELQRAMALRALAPTDRQAHAILRRAQRCYDGILAIRSGTARVSLPDRRSTTGSLFPGTQIALELRGR